MQKIVQEELLENFANYFVIEFSRNFKITGFGVEADSFLKNTKLKGEHVGSYYLLIQPIMEIEVKISSSFISHEQAIINLNRELPNSKSFDKI